MHYRQGKCPRHVITRGGKQGHTRSIEAGRSQRGGDKVRPIPGAGGAMGFGGIRMYARERRDRAECEAHDRGDPSPERVFIDRRQS